MSEERRDALGALRERLIATLVPQVLAQRRRLAAFEDRLRALSPRLVLERGYCLARMPDGTLLRAADSLVVGDDVTLEFARGEADARVTGVRPGGAHGA
jgi:exodeoxyribonuclease VII large subunit